jgi:hypothetical protein
MSTHQIKSNEVGKALVEYVMRRDNVDQTKTHRMHVDSHCDILMIGDGPIFTIHLTPIAMVPGGQG